MCLLYCLDKEIVGRVTERYRLPGFPDHLARRTAAVLAGGSTMQAVAVGVDDLRMADDAVGPVSGITRSVISKWDLPLAPASMLPRSPLCRFLSAVPPWGLLNGL